MSGPRKTSKSSADGGVPETEAAAAMATPAKASAPEAAVPPPSAPVRPPPAAPAPPPPPAAPAASAAPAGPPPGAQVAAAISGLAAGIKEKLGTAELLLGAGALLIAGLSWLILGVILGSGGPAGIYGPTETATVASVLLLVLIGLERTEREGFGTWYRVLLILLGAILAVGAAYSLLNTIRHSSGFLGGLDWLAVLIWWIGGGMAGAGAWLTYKVRA